MDATLSSIVMSSVLLFEPVASVLPALSVIVIVLSLLAVAGVKETLMGRDPH